MDNNKNPLSYATLFDDFEIDGTWWLPGKKELEKEGVLTFSSESELALVIEKGFIFQSPWNGVNEYPLINGLDKFKRPCTLRANFNVGLGVSCMFQSRHLLVGKHFEREEDLSFNSIALSFNGLEAWYNHSPITREQTRSNGKAEVTITYKTPEELSFHLDGLDMTLSTFSGFSSSGKSGLSADVTHRSYLKLASTSPKPFNWFLDHVNHLQRFFSLLMDMPVYVKESAIRAEGDTEACLVFAVQSNRTIAKVVHPTRMLFALPSIITQLPTILSNWIKKSESLAMVYELLAITYYNPETNPRFTFLSMTQALETFHRVIFKGSYMNEDEYKPYRQTMTSNIPKEISDGHREALKSRIRFGYDYSLLKRLTILLKSLSETTQKLLVGDTGNFITQIKNTRNYLTHGDETTKEDVFKPEDYARTNALLRIWLQILLLIQLGLSEDQVVNAFSHRIENLR